MERQTHPHERSGSAEQAAEWLQRLQRGGGADKRAFLRWLKRSPQNIGETLLATSTDIVLRQYFQKRSIDVERELQTTNVVHVALQPESTHRATISRRKHWMWGSGLAASLLIMVLFLFQSSALIDWWREQQYVTAVGEQRTIELSDGSSLAINTASAVRVRFSDDARDVFLDHGQALFKVAKDAHRPFRVRVGGSIVQAIGTKFDVRRRSGPTRVAVAEGTVQIDRDVSRKAGEAVASKSNLARVTAGEAVSIVAPGHVKAPVPVRISEIGLWQQQRLVFADSTLAEIAEEFAHYNRRPHIRIEGDALRARRLSGVFDAGSPEALLVFFAADETVEVRRQNDEIVIRARPAIIRAD